MNALDSIPERPKMPKVSRVLYTSNRYTACLIGPGLVIQDNYHGTGKLLPTTHPQYADYIEAIETALDKAEADMICRVFLR